MKQYLHLFITLIFLNCTLTNIYSQNLIEVSGTIYTHRITNISKYHIKVHDSHYNETRRLKPNAIWTREEYFPKSKFRKTKITCSYDEDTYQLDKKYILDLEENMQNSLDIDVNWKLKDNDEVLLKKFAVIGIRDNIKSNSNNGFLTKLGKGILRGGSRAYLGYRDVLEGFDSISNIDMPEDLYDYLDSKFTKYF